MSIVVMRGMSTFGFVIVVVADDLVAVDEDVVVVVDAVTVGFESFVVAVFCDVAAASFVALAALSSNERRMGYYKTVPHRDKKLTKTTNNN